MELLKFTVRNQHLSGGRTRLVSDSIDYVEADFDFRTGDWDGLSKWAHFTKGETVYDINLVNDKITRDMHLNLGTGIWEVKLHGTDPGGTMRITTDTAYVRVDSYGSLEEGSPLPEIPLSAAEQIDAKSQLALDNSEEAILKAEENAVSDEKIAEAVENYFAENPQTEIVTDESLSVSGAAADAAVCGQRFESVEQRLYEAENAGTDVINKILDPDNYPISESAEVTVSCVMETGALDSSGGESESPTQIRSDFVEVSSKSGKICAGEDWEEDLRVLGYDAEKNFVEKKYASAGSEFSIPETWAYLRFYTGSTEIEFSFVTGTPETKAEFKKIYIRDQGYYIKGENISGSDSHKVVIQASGLDENTYNITEIRAPSENPEEATLCLTNWGNGINQMVDISSMAYDPENPTMEIVCQARNGSPLPQFSVRFNDGEGAGRVKKFVVNPDAVPVELTSAGIRVRKNNTYDNAADESEYVTVDLADFYSKMTRRTVSVDLSGYENGTIVETYSDGSALTFSLAFDADGNITKITDSNGNETVITW